MTKTASQLYRLGPGVRVRSLSEMPIRISLMRVGDASLMEDDPPIYGMPQGLITTEGIRDIVSRYEVPPEYM